MAETPVTGLTIRHSRWDQDVTVEINWALLPKPTQRAFDRLDRDDSGTLVYSPESTPGALSELTDADGSAAEFRRHFWAFGDNPYQNAALNHQTRAARHAAVWQLQDQVYDHIILGNGSGRSALIADPENIGQWHEAGRLLELLADSRHLYALAGEAWGYWQARHDEKFLRVAEHFLLEAERFEAAFPDQPRGLVGKIKSLKTHVAHELDRIDREQFARWIQEPYLMPAFEAPVTVNLQAGQEGARVMIRVAIPQDMTETRFAEFFKTHPLIARPAMLAADQPAGEEYVLEFETVLLEQEGVKNLDYNSVIFEPNINDVHFGGKRHYFQAVFKMPAAQAALGDRAVRKFDLVLRGPGHELREMPGTLVLQNLAGKTTRLLFASDIHINERDYETARVMIESLRDTGDPLRREVQKQRYVERVERFYSSFNENVEALVEEANARYRRGDCHRVVITGDLADFINVAFTLKDQGYRGTNVRRLFHILSKLEAPLAMKPGNHDPHIAPYARAEHKQGFSDDPELYGLYGDHYDRTILPASGQLMSKVYSLLSLLTRRCSIEDMGLAECAIEVGKELFAGDPFEHSEEEGMGPYFRWLGTNDADMTYLGNGQYLFQWKTNEEHFNQQRWVFEELEEPVGPNLFAGAGTYLNRQYVNGKGPRYETAVYFIRQVARLRERGETMILAQHYPNFHKGVSASDQTRDAADALRGEPNWLIRLAAYYFKHPDGRPVIDTIVAGHVHKWGEYDFKFNFDNPEEAVRFHADLRRIFEAAARGEVSGEELYEMVHEELWHRYHLDKRIETRMIVGTGPTDPGAIVSEYNSDSKRYGRTRGTLYVNQAAVGPAGGSSPPGYLMMEIKPDGSKTLAPYFFYREANGTVAHVPGTRLPDLQYRHDQGSVAFKRSLGLTVPDAVRQEGAPELVLSPSRPIEHWRFDGFPLLCQYPKGKSCLAVGVGPEVDLVQGKFGAIITPLQLTIPLSDHHNALWGLNYLRPAIDYSTVHALLSLRTDLGLGLFEPYVTAGLWAHGGAPRRHGVGLLLAGASAMTVPALDLGWSTTEDGEDHRVMLRARWYWDWLSVEP